MAKILASLLAVLLMAQAAFAQTGDFSFDNPTYFPSACKKPGQLALVFAQGPSTYTAQILTNINGVTDAKNLNFFPITTYLKDVTSNVPLRAASTAGAFIGQAWPTSRTLKGMSAADIATQLEQDCNQIYVYTTKYPKYIYVPRDQIDQTSYTAIVAQGYVPIAYNLDSSDYLYSNTTDPTTCIAGVTAAYKTFLGQLPNGSAYWIALERDLWSCTALSVANVIQTITGYGYTLVDMGTCLGDASPYRTSCTASGASTSGSASAAGNSGSTTTKKADTAATTAAAAQATQGSSTSSSSSSAAAGTKSAATSSVVVSVFVTVFAALLAVLAMML